MQILSENVQEAMRRHKIFFEAEEGQVGVSVYHPVENLTAVVFYPGNEDIGECSVGISYPNNFTTCQIALRELEDLVRDPEEDFAYLTLRRILENKESYFRRG